VRFLTIENKNNKERGRIKEKVREPKKKKPPLNKGQNLKRIRNSNKEREKKSQPTLSFVPEAAFSNRSFSN